jgi:hypothetical protein
MYDVTPLVAISMHVSGCNWYMRSLHGWMTNDMHGLAIILIHDIIKVWEILCG